MPNSGDYPAPHTVPWKRRDGRNHNCYDYALNIAGDWSQPGQYGKGRLRMEFISRAAPDWKKLVSLPSAPKWLKPRLKTMFKDTVLRAASDGLVPVNAPVSSEGFRLIALQFILSPGECGHHWVRLDNNGRWSDKNGDARVRDVVDQDGENVLWPHESFKPDERSRTRTDCHYMFGSYFLAPANSNNLGGLPFDSPPLPLLEAY